MNFNEKVTKICGKTSGTETTRTAEADWGRNTRKSVEINIGKDNKNVKKSYWH